MTSTRQAPRRSSRDRHDPRRRAWRAVMVVASRTRALIDTALKDGLDLDIVTYDAMLHVFEAGDGGIRMTDLAEAVLFTRAGATSMVDRLVESGLAARIPDADDRRVTRAVLTPTGEQLFRRAAGVHNEVVAEAVTSHLDEDEAEAVARALERVSTFDVAG